MPAVNPDVVVTPDVAVVDASPDVIAPADVKTTDSTTPGDVAAKPTKCTADSDCKGSFGSCLTVGCNLGTGNCELKPVADGTACSTAGQCGGSGVCKLGACNAASSCGPQPCAPTPIQCGAKMVLTMGDIGASKLKNYSCSATSWDGGEKIVSLSSEVTVVVVAELSSAVTPTAIILAMPPAAAGACAPGACDAAGTKLTFGIAPGVARLLVVDALAGDNNTVTLTVTCTKPVVCGDSVCSEGESCATCAKDCGSCATCGDKTCDAKFENCQTCPGDCGACPKECVVNNDAGGCSGCACEACVIAKDSFCKDTAWDSTCIGECTNDCQGPKCADLIKPFCGDGVCDTVTNSESGTNCPNDCPGATKCGDGVCDPGGETCSGCSLDCGICPGATPSCGDGTCNGKEHCGSCPQDCGVCGKMCVANVGPTCNGCSCEATVCASDSYCCKSAWDSTCVSECATASGDKCPKVTCGDGVCSGSETCSSCKGDCGACPIKCGDGKCDAPTETKDNCPDDCAAASCNGKCGGSAGSGVNTCYCDSVCTDSGDCCADKAQFCP